MKGNIKKIIEYLIRINKENPEKVIYLVGIFIFIWIIILMFYSLMMTKFTPINYGECVFKKITGLYCPGCGGTRAFIYLVQGNICKSIYYNIFSTYATLLYIIFMGSHTLFYITKGLIKGLKFRPWFIYLGIILLLLQWVIKNIMIIFFSESMI